MTNSNKEKWENRHSLAEWEEVGKYKSCEKRKSDENFEISFSNCDYLDSWSDLEGVLTPISSINTEWAIFIQNQFRHFLGKSRKGVFDSRIAFAIKNTEVFWRHFLILFCITRWKDRWWQLAEKNMPKENSKKHFGKIKEKCRMMKGEFCSFTADKK